MATEAAPPSPAAARGSRFALSPINRRRWRNFKSNRRGYWALWLFLFIFVVTLFAELVANSRPLLIVDRGHSQDVGKIVKELNQSGRTDLI